MIITSISYFILIFITFSICKKFNFFLDKKDQNHKKFASNQKNNFVGGFFIELFLKKVTTILMAYMIIRFYVAHFLQYFLLQFYYMT